MSAADLSALIGSAKGGVVTLDPPGKEFQGPVAIRQPVTIRGQGGTIWAERGPVLVIESGGVVLEDLNVEVTGRDEAVGEAGCAVVARGAAPRLARVAVRGHVLGIPGEEGEWRYPGAVRLHKIKAAVPHTFTLRLAIPVPCKIESLVSGVAVGPTSLPAGLVDVTVKVEPLAERIRLKGSFRLSTPGLTRRIEFSAHLAADGSGVTVGTGQVVYEPADVAAVPPPPAVPPPAASAPPTKLEAPPPPPEQPPHAGGSPDPIVQPVPPPPQLPPVEKPKSRYRLGTSPLSPALFGGPPAEAPPDSVATDPPASIPVKGYRTIRTSPQSSVLFGTPAPDPPPEPPPPAPSEADPPLPRPADDERAKKAGGMQKARRMSGLFGGDPPAAE